MTCPRCGLLGPPLTERCDCGCLLGVKLHLNETTSTGVPTSRGRRGREWKSPRGAGLLFSLSLHPKTPPGRLPPLTLVVADAVAEAAWPEAAVRWPNDVVVDGHKLAGILAEVRDGEVVVGIGVNANHELDDLPADARVAPTSLRLLSGGTVDRAALLADILEPSSATASRVSSATSCAAAG